MYLGRGGAGSARLLQTTNCLNSTVKECVAYINSLLQADVKQRKWVAVVYLLRETWETEPD